MSVSPTLKVVLCWHMHQPHYFDRESGQYQLPWTYLHAIKDYVDMAAIIEGTPGARAVVNFAPTLLEQIDDYAKQVADYLKDGTVLKDPLLAALVSPEMPVDEEQRLYLIRACLKANEKHLINRYPQFRSLADLADCVLEKPGTAHYLSSQYLIDILVWYHLAWIGETVRRESAQIQDLVEKGTTYTLEDRKSLLIIIGDLLAGVLDRYKRLAEQGSIELSVTPYAHPIVPLLLDIQSTKEAMPGAQMPQLEQYPGGRERVDWHIKEGKRVFKHYFGMEPTGCWPSEGSVSTEALAVFDEAGFSWVASGESVLRNSLHQSGMEHLDCIHRPYKVENSDIKCFFRDDGLSDSIGFTYADWYGDDAVNTLVHHLENIANACGNEKNRVVSIIMDGENAWEHYPENGYHFLTWLYQRIAEHPSLELTTFGDCIDDGMEATELKTLVAGSWVYGSFSTWIGDKDKNRAWDLLGAAKIAFDQAVASGRLKSDRLREAEHQLAICEGSDWFWWFGDYNPADSVRDFERLFRLQLVELYRLIGVEAPEELSHAISHGGGSPQAGGVMRRGQE